MNINPAAIYSQADFARMCGVERQHINKCLKPENNKLNSIIISGVPHVLYDKKAEDFINDIKSRRM